MKTAIVLGSSRSKGNTGALAQLVATELDAELFDLADYFILPYRYEHDQKDDFRNLITQLLKFDRLVLASPMYWYSASAQMKVFLDRLSDLLDGDKEMGRQLRGKEAALLATGYIDKPPECFEQMFALTFNYLGMKYKGMNYASCSESFNHDLHRTAVSSFVSDLTI